MNKLEKLRKKLEEMTRRASGLKARIADDTPADEARGIEEEHTALLAEIEQVRADIADLEAEEEDGTETRSAAGQPLQRQPENRDDTAAERRRTTEIMQVGEQAGMDADAIRAAISDGTSIETFRTRAFDHMVEQARPSRQRGIVDVRQDEQEVRRNARTEALSYRMGAPIGADGPSEAARQYMGDGMIALAMETTGETRYPRNVRETEDLFTRASHTTSDFPIILENAINRTLEGRYALAQPTYRRIARQRNFRDFRPHTMVKTGDFPMLEKVLEDGEIKYGSLTEGKETISVLSYARAISVSRQLMINDDLGAIQDMLSSYGDTVALFEEITFYANAFNGKLADGKAVFHADHNNLAASGGGIDPDTVAAGRLAMSKQKSISGNPLMSNRPAIILTGPATLTAAEKLLASITPATVSNVNIFSGRLSVEDTA
ncbi:MAG: Mu-like prophage major head subunit gpT family protein, partial [Martelella sp.]